MITLSFKKMRCQGVGVFIEVCVEFKLFEGFERFFYSSKIIAKAIQTKNYYFWNAKLNILLL